MENKKRLIYADVAKEMILSHANEFSDALNRREKALLIGGGTSCVDKCPTIDAVEVVRCKDCKWAKSYDRGDGLTGYYCQDPNSTFLYGTNWERIFEPVRESNDFCSRGNKKEA